jgi:hypothetical protein
MLITRQVVAELVGLDHNPTQPFQTVIELVGNVYERLDRLVTTVNALSEDDRLALLTADDCLNQGEWLQAQRLRLAAAAFVEMVGMFHLYDNRLGQSLDADQLQAELRPEGSLGSLVISIAKKYCECSGCKA